MFNDFATPQWLVAGAAALAALALAMVYAEGRRRRALRRFAAATPISTASPARRWTRNALALAGVAFAFIALARPRGGYRLEQTPRQGVDLMFAVDTSKSMRAADLAPDRLTRAKLAVTDLVDKFPAPRVGLIAFAGGAFVQAPMTADHAPFLEALQSLDTDVIPRPGTDLSSAIRAARQAMASEPTNRKLLVLVSDGENLTGDALAAAREAAQDNVQIFTVGVGTSHGDLIETISPSGARELVRDEQGTPVRSKLDETTLRSIAQVTHGDYEPLGADGRGLERLYAKSLSNLARATTMTTTTHKVYKERYQFPLAIALACLLLELVLQDRKRAAQRRGRAAPRRGRATATAVVAMLAIPTIPVVASANPVPVDTYNGGTEAYRRGDFEGAQKQFDGALHTKNVELQANAYYNLGNARYRLGEHALKTDKAQTMAAWKTALEAYDAALALQPKDADAKFNRDLVARKLAALEREQQQQQPQSGSQSGQQSSSQNGGSSNGQQQNGSSSGQQSNGSPNGQQSNGQQGGSQNGQQQNGSSSGQQSNGSPNGQQSNGQQQNGSSSGQQSSASPNGQQSNGQQGGSQNGGSSNGQQGGSQNGRQSNGSSSGKQSNGQQAGSQNGQQSSASSSGQQSNGSSNGQKPNIRQSNEQQQSGSSDDQQRNGPSSGQQPNTRQSNGQQPNGQQPNGQQPNGQQANTRQSNDRQDATRGPQPNAPQDARALAPSNASPGADNRSLTDAERQAQAARVHAPDAAASRSGESPSASTAGAASGNAPTTAAERAAERAADNARKAAGQLTRREALQLLDAAEHELKPMPIDGKARATERSTTTVKDW